MILKLKRTNCLICVHLVRSIVPVLMSNLLGDSVGRQASSLFLCPVTCPSFRQDTVMHTLTFLCQLVLLSDLETASSVFVCIPDCRCFAKTNICLNQKKFSSLGI